MQTEHNRVDIFKATFSEYSMHHIVSTETCAEVALLIIIDGGHCTKLSDKTDVGIYSQCWYRVTVIK